jgi:hypothetical protein
VPVNRSKDLFGGEHGLLLFFSATPSVSSYSPAGLVSRYQIVG